MNPQLKPRFDEKRFLFFREENAGYASAISPGDPNKALHVLNPTVYDIGRMCTGEATLAEIQARYAARFQQDPSSPLVKYVEEAILLLSLYNLLTFSGEAPPTTSGEPIPIVRRLEEWDLGPLRTLLLGGRFPEKDGMPMLHYRHPYLSPESYNEMLLRLRIFQNQEFFYAVTAGPRIDFVVSCLDERPLKPVAVVASIVGTGRYTLADGLSYVLPVLLDDVRTSLHKLQWRRVVGTDDYPELAALFQSHGFQLEAALRDEFGPGHDEEIFYKILDPPPSK
jgi:hypothetical protein